MRRSQGFPNGVYVTSDKYLAENDGVVDRFVRAMNKSAGLRAGPPGRGAGDHPEFTKIPAAAAAKIRLPPFDSEIDRTGIEAEAELTAKFGIIDEVPRRRT